MMIRVAELQCREVINICNGQRLGFVCDIEFDSVEGHVKSLVVPGPSRFFGLFGREEDYIIAWDCIERFGDDIILINVSGEVHRGRKEKKKIWY